jgi:VanZ family protein
MILAIAWMILIFAFSSRTGTESAGDSYQAGLLIGNLVVHNFEEWPKERQIAFAKKIDHPIRKTAHASEYAILGIMLVNAYACLPEKRRYFFAWLTAAIYAGTDEFHQLFVPGRSGQFTDVMIDSSGAFAGVLFMAGVIAFMQKR